MSLFHKNTLLGASGAGDAGEVLYVDDVFSIDLWDGSGTARDIDNDIDLSGEGGMVWIKVRNLTTLDHNLYDTERGATKDVNTNNNLAEGVNAARLSAFNSDGYSLGTNSHVNATNYDYVGWTFRKAPGFFDVVTYTGTGSLQTISHSLGSVPGMIWIKRTDSSGEWICYHREIDITGGYFTEVDNFTQSNTNGSTYFNSTEATSSVFTVNTNDHVNANGGSYVAYIFAHDDQSFGDNSDEAIIKCGKYSGTGTTTGNVVDLGFEPQLLIVKRLDAANHWLIFDTMRGLNVKGLNDARLYVTDISAEATTVDYFTINSNGFQATSTSTLVNASGGTYIYMAIRRPHKPPTDGTDVFAPQASRAASDGTSSQLHFTSNFPVDLLFQICNAGNSANVITVDRMRGGQYLSTSSTAAEQSTIWKFDSMDGVYFTTSTSATSDFGAYMFRRAPGFFDVVAYTGNGGSQTLSHNLEATPELMLVKERSATGGWEVYNSDGGNTKFLELNGSGTYSTNQFSWNNTSPTSTQFTVGANNSASGTTYIAYLFATLDGISKVGTYSGTGSDLDVDCGFTAGARLVIIRRTNIASGSKAGDWYYFDSARGIATGNDPHNFLNYGSLADITNTDYIDPLNSGFTVTSGAGAALNASGGTYLFLAIA